MESAVSAMQEKPLGRDMEEWDDFLKGRYKEGKSQDEFRQYDAQANPGVARFYQLNHEHQTLDYVLSKEKQYFGLNRGQKSIWEAAEFLNKLVDDSDPDTDLTQIEHLLQTSEAIRADGRLMRDVYYAEAKKPDAMQGPTDLIKLVKKMPGSEAFIPVDESECKLLKK